MANFAVFGEGSNTFHQISQTTGGNYADPLPMFGDLPLENTEYSHTNPIPFPDAILSVHAGNNHTLIHTERGKAFGIGWNDYGQLGVGTWYEDTSKNPILRNFSYHTFHEAVIHGHTIHKVYSRQNFTVFVTHDFRAWSCGWNNHSCLGLGSSASSEYAVQLITGNNFSSKKVVHVRQGGCYMLLWTSEGKMYATGHPAGVDSIQDFNFKAPIEWTPLKNQLWHNERFVDAVCLSNHITLVTNHGRAWLFDKTAVTQVRGDYIREVWEAKRGCLYRENNGGLYRYTKETGVTKIDVPFYVTYMFEHSDQNTNVLLSDGHKAYHYEYNSKELTELKLPDFGLGYDLEISDSGMHTLFLIRKKVSAVLQKKMWSTVGRAFCDIDVATWH